MSTPHLLSKITIGLHWIIAIGVIVLLYTGYYMATFEVWGLYGWHKATGVVLSLVIVLRVIWRLAKDWPQALGATHAFEQTLAKLTHGFLLLASLAMPLSGLMYSGASGHGVFVASIQIIPKNISAENPEEVVPFSPKLKEIGWNTHHHLGYTMMLILGLHIAGALKHQIIYKDRTLKRMLGG